MVACECALCVCCVLAAVLLFEIFYHSQSTLEMKRKPIVNKKKNQKSMTPTFFVPFVVVRLQETAELDDFLVLRV